MMVVNNAGGHYWKMPTLDPYCSRTSLDFARCQSVATKSDTGHVVLLITEMLPIVNVSFSMDFMYAVSFLLSFRRTRRVEDDLADSRRTTKSREAAESNSLID